MAPMSSVILISSSGDEVEVTTTREFNHLVYNLGWLPKTGTVEDNFEVLLTGAGSPAPSNNDYVRVGDVVDADSTIGEVLRGAFLARWKPYENLQADELRLSPDGQVIRRNSAGATRGEYDATEAGLWTAVAGGSGGTAGPHTHDDRYFTEAEINAALAGKANATHSHPEYATDAELTDGLAGKAAVGHGHTGFVTSTDLATASTADRDRANHTGTQDVSTLTGLTPAVRDIVAGFLKSGANVTLTRSADLATLTVASSGGTGGGGTPGATDIDGGGPSTTTFTEDYDGGTP